MSLKTKVVRQSLFRDHCRHLFELYLFFAAGRRDEAAAGTRIERADEFGNDTG